MFKHYGSTPSSKGICLIFSLCFSSMLSGTARSKSIQTSKFDSRDYEILVSKVSARIKISEIKKGKKSSHGTAPPKKIKALLHHRSLVRYPNVLEKNINNKEYKRNYSSFYDSYSQHMTSKFIKRWKTRFLNASHKYGVAPEIIAAIILVETGLGSIKGRYHVGSVFASIIVEATKALRGKVDNPARYKKKLNWATDELASLIRSELTNKLSITALKGSRSGAFGMSQFLPSSFERWAVDGDQSGEIDLNSPPDAIASIGNYLKTQGWISGAAYSENREAIYHYNNSTIYVDTIIKLADLIRTKHSQKTTAH